MNQETSYILRTAGKESRSLVLRLQKLIELGTALSAERDLHRLLALILRESRWLLHADSGSMFLREDEVRTFPEATVRDELEHRTPWLCLKVAQSDSIARDDGVRATSR